MPSEETRPGPSPTRGPLPLRRMLAAALDNPHDLWTREFFETPIARVRAPFGDRLVISDPEAARHVLVEAADRYGRDPVQRHILARVTGRGLFMAEGEAWAGQRRALAPFFAPRAVAALAPSFRDAAEECAATLAKRERVELCGAMAAFAVGVLDRTLLGGRLAEPADVVARDVRRFADAAGRVGLADLLDLPDWVPRLSHWRARGEAKRVRARAVAIRRDASARPKAGCVVSAMLAARAADGAPLFDDRAVEDNVSTLIGAGADTTALALAWAIWLASGDAPTREALDAECAALDEATPAGAHAAAPFARAVIEEALRLYPPAPAIGRMARIDDRIGDLAAARGTAIVVAPWVMHRHRLLWRDPDAFDPFRFLPGARERLVRGAFLPFGAGPRICLGWRYALDEAAIGLVTLWRRLRFTWDGEGPGELRHNITLQPEGGLHVRVEPRR